jgi:TatD DNase family protein
LWATVGLHPIHTSPSFHDKDEGEETTEEIFDYDFYKTLALHPKVVAIGECGLDYFRITGDEEAYKTRQREAFAMQMKLAHEVKKPLMIHCRSAYPDVLGMLDEAKSLLLPNPGVSHFFAGNADEARRLLEMGFSFTFGGAITLPKRAGGTDYEEIIALMPEDRILVETDAPYVAPLAHRGKRNEPAYIVHAVKRLAELRGVSYDRMAEITRENTEKVFGLGK